MKPSSVLAPFAALPLMFAAACGPDCKTDCAFKCANSPTHACAEQCEKDDCGIEETDAEGSAAAAAACSSTAREACPSSTTN